MRSRRFGARHFAELAIVALLGGCGATRVTPDREVTVAPSRGAVYGPGAFAGYVAAVVAERRGDLARAAELITLAVDEGAADPHLRSEQARLLAAAGRFDEAERALRIARQLEIPPWQAAMLEAAIDEGRGNAQGALAAFAEADATDAPEEFYLAWMAVAARAEAPQVRVDAARRWTEVAPDSARAWRSLGAALRDAGDAHAGAEAFAAASRSVGGDPWDAEQQINVLLNAGDVDAARDAALQCRASFRSHVPCAALLVLTLAEPGAIGEQASVALDELAALTSGDRRAIGRYADGFTVLGRADLASAYTARVAALRPLNTAILTAAAWASARASNETQAIELMLRVIALDEANFDALNYVGYAWAEAGRNLDEAEALLRRAVELRPDNGNIRDSLAWALYRLGRHEEALIEQQRAVADSPENAVLYDHLGDILSALGQTEAAIEAWEDALRFVQPGDEDVQETVPAKIEQARQQLAR